MFEDSNEDLNVRDPTNATCHSCRYRSENPKMSCSGFRKNGLPCGLRFCSRCIERRFPDVHFDAYNRSYTCPKCLRTCSCAECRRRWLSEMENHGPDIQSVSSKNTADAVNVRAEGLSPLAQPFSTRQPAETADDDLGEGPSSLMRTAPSSLMRKASTKAIYAMKSTVVEAFSGEEMSASEEIQDDDGSDYIVVDNSKARAYAGPSNTTLKKTMARSKTSGSKRKNKNLPELVPNKTCHQCRKREDSYEKMICNNVPKGRRPCRGTYCRRCIVKRYPDIVFKSLGRFRCPKCYGKCNCDQCAKARGERYIREKEFQEMLEAKGIVPEGLAAEIPPLSPKKARRKLKAACEHNVELVNIGEEAEEWVQLRREEICAQGEDHYPKRLRAFVGDWHSMWGTTRTCLAMDSADAPVGQASSSNSATHLSDVPTSGGTRRRLYIGDTAGLHRTFVSVDSVHLSEDELILNDEDPQGAIEVDIVRSRSGRLITPSAKIRQYDDSEDDVSLSAPTRKKRRKLSAGAAHNSSLPSVRPASKTPVTPLFTAFSATERSPLSMFGSPLTDRDASGESEPDIIESFSVDLPKIGEDTTKEASLPPGTLDLLPLEPMEAESAVDVGSSFGESLSSGPTQDALTNFDVPDHLKTEAADKTGPGGPFEEYVTENELGIDGHAETTAENVALAVQAI
ncbi:hypothetical protein DFH11DRAFT_647378 [Phellopilus nigrolimitatus]|nr:hypothetical protein DFH11DRAFT_647378 [Phellopilus nigrolimitatus]